MLNGATPSDFAMAGRRVQDRRVQRLHEESHATSHGKKRFTASMKSRRTGATAASAAGLMTAASGFIAWKKISSRRLISMRVAFWMNHAFTSTRRDRIIFRLPLQPFGAMIG